MTHKRRQFLTHRKYQFIYTFWILLGMLAVSVFITVITVVKAYPVFTEMLSGAVTPSITREIVLLLIKHYWVGFLILALFAVAFGILLSHRIVGPVNRMASILANIEKGTLTHRIVLRKYDEFTPLADAINLLLENFSESIKKMRSALAELKKTVKNPETSQKAEEILKKITEIEEQLSRYTTDEDRHI